jgi:dsDNA-specific endonuclease/ATPase MutS2
MEKGVFSPTTFYYLCREFILKNEINKCVEMSFVFSNHALEQMQLRQISRSIVEKILEKPQQIIKENNILIYQSVVLIEKKNYLIRVFINHNKKPNVVITVYKTSKISKYNESKI